MPAGTAGPPPGNAPERILRAFVRGRRGSRGRAGAPDQALIKQLVHLVYDVRRDDARFRARLGLPGSFDEQRKHYPERRELSSLQIEGAFADKALGALGFALSHP